MSFTEARILTIQWDSRTGMFDDSVLRNYLINRELVRCVPQFFEHKGLPCWSLYVEATVIQGVVASDLSAPERQAAAAAVAAQISEFDEIQKVRYERIVAWRAEAAMREGLKSYMICTNRDAMELACTAPATRLERLCRYGLRAPFSQDRLSLTTDGQVRYRLHRPWPTPAGRTEIVLEPVAFLRRLATLLPAPYQNLVRYHGVFANRSRYRKALPHPPARPKNARGDDKTPGDRQLPNVPVTPKPGEFRKRTHPSWAALLHRALHVDALSCPRCATPMVVLAFLTDPAVVTSILDHLHLPSTVPAIAPARDTDDLWALDDHGIREPTSGYVTVGRLALRRRRPGNKASRPGPGPARDPPAVNIS